MFNYKDLTLPEPEATEPPPAVQPLVEAKALEPIEPTYYSSKPKQPKPESWERNIAELETYFTGIILPKEPIEICQGSTITDIPKFIDSHLAIVKTYNGKRTFLPYLTRLFELKQYLTLSLN